MNRIAMSLGFALVSIPMIFTGFLGAGTAGAATGLAGLTTPEMVKVQTEDVAHDAHNLAEFSFAVIDGVAPANEVSDLTGPINVSLSEMEGLRSMTQFGPIVQITELGAARVQAVLASEAGIPVGQLDAELTSLNAQAFRACFAGTEVAGLEQHGETVAPADLQFIYTIVTNNDDGTDVQNKVITTAFDIGRTTGNCLSGTDFTVTI